MPGVIRAYVNPSTEMAYVQADHLLTPLCWYASSNGFASCRRSHPPLAVRAPACPARTPIPTDAR